MLFQALGERGIHVQPASHCAISPWLICCNIATYWASSVVQNDIENNCFQHIASGDLLRSSPPTFCNFEQWLWRHNGLFREGCYQGMPPSAYMPRWCTLILVTKAPKTLAAMIMVLQLEVIRHFCCDYKNLEHRQNLGDLRGNLWWFGVIAVASQSQLSSHCDLWQFVNATRYRLESQSVRRA